MKKLKTVSALVLALALALSLAGCGGEKKEPIDVAALADELLGAAEFGETMTALDSAVALSLYSAPEGTSVAAYAGSGATAEELAVFDCGSAENAGALMTSLEERNTTRTNDYASYNPAEVPKLENAVILQGGQYVVLIVAADASGAESISADALSGR